MAGLARLWLSQAAFTPRQASTVALPITVAWATFSRDFLSFLASLREVVVT